MGTPLNASTIAPLRAAATRLNLTPREIEVCAMVFVDGRAETLVAEWLSVTLQCVRQCVANALRKEPALRTLRVETKRPRIVHLSQIENPRDRERGPFNADEL